jgi:MtaA/CmuA family methyltransferase
MQNGFSMNSKERFLAVINGSEPDRVPVFPLLMSFAARRYGVTYRQFASNGHVMAQSQLQIRDTFGVDAITACSDAFRIAADLGGEIIYPEENPPYLAQPLVCSENDLRHLKRPDIARASGRMADRIMGAGEMARAAGADCMVLGWVDMPFAEACSLCGVSRFMIMLYDEPDLARQILDFLTVIVIDFAVAQIEAGVPMVGAGDAAASLVSPALYREFALPFERSVCDAVHRAGGLVKLHICGNTTNLLKDMVLSGADLFNVDHLVDLQTAAVIYSTVHKAFKGNINPVSDMLFASPEECAAKAIAYIETMRNRPYMLSPGCEVPADVTDEIFQALCRAPEKTNQTREDKKI